MFSVNHLHVRKYGIMAIFGYLVSDWNPLQVMEILRTTELFTSQLKADSMMREDPLTTSLIEALITVSH